MRLSRTHTLGLDRKNMENMKNHVPGAPHNARAKKGLGSKKEDWVIKFERKLNISNEPDRQKNSHVQSLLIVLCDSWRKQAEFSKATFDSFTVLCRMSRKKRAEFWSSIDYFYSWLRSVECGLMIFDVFISCFLSDTHKNNSMEFRIYALITVQNPWRYQRRYQRESWGCYSAQFSSN